ncbi:MAG: DUF1577 domain-containing protein [Leptospiraceae bacterium]|nr:DUF1577 domain-containing protein [Leptospiraceae bacterium]
MKPLIEKERDWDFVRNPEKVAALLRDRLAKVKFYLKRTEPPAEFYRGNEQDGLFEYHYSPELELEREVTLYSTLKRQVEVDFLVESTPEPGTAWMRPQEVRVGKVAREHARFNVTNGSIFATNVRVSKNEIAIDNTRPQVSNKVIFKEFEKHLNQEIAGLKIFDYASRERPEETKLLNKSTEAILVTDVSDFSTYKPVEPGIFNYYEYLEDEDLLEKTRRRYQESHIESVVAVPILYEMADGRHLPIAFFYAESPRGQSAFDINTVARLREVSQEIIDRIVDANMISVKDRQGVVNISEGGVALELTHPDLVKYVPHRKEIIFDLIFKMQAPLRFRGQICHLQEIGPGHLMIGMNLAGSGHSDFRKSSMDRLRSLVRMLSETG